MHITLLKESLICGSLCQLCYLCRIYNTKLDNFRNNQETIYDCRSKIHGTSNRSEIVVRTF